MGLDDVSRGWYKGQREFGSARVPWEFCLAEWNAQFLGDRAFQISEPEKANLRWEARQFRAGNLWHRWDYPYEVGSTRFEERYPVFARYLTDNWRAFRTWEVSALSPWEHGHFWKLREGVDKRRRELDVDWENLQRPGFSPDYIDQRYERMDLAYDVSDWIVTPAAAALLRNNRPLLACLAGKPFGFTSKDHNFYAGETVEKQIVVINNSREMVTCDCAWLFGLSVGVTGGKKTVTVAAGRQERIPLRFELAPTLPPGTFDLVADFRFSTGETQANSLSINVLPLPTTLQVSAKVALFDPQGETGALLNKLGVQSQAVEAGADLSAYDVLVVGKSALTVGGPAPDIRRVREGLKVIVFEQTADVLEQRLGFRVQEYGLRQVFARVPDHPCLNGISAEHLHDWRGEATILPPRLKYEMRPRYGPTVQWCDIPVTRLWRCGNRGNVASVLIEKPARGDFLPILDGGYSLQYSPLMEYREGKGMVILCQMDVTGRTESDPAAQTLLGNILEYVSAWRPSSRREVLYAGEPAGSVHLQAAGFRPGHYTGGNLRAGQVLVLGPGSKALAPHGDAIRTFLMANGRLLAVGLTQEDADALLPFKVSMKQAEHINAYFDAPGANSPLAGVGPADVHNRDPRELPLVSGGAEVFGNGVLAQAPRANVVFCQLAPWQFGPSTQSNLKRTYRRTSFLVSRLLANLGAAGSTPLLDRFHQPLDEAKSEKRWQDGLYLDQPEEWDDPYRFFRW